MLDELSANLPARLTMDVTALPAVARHIARMFVNKFEPLASTHALQELL